MIRDSRVRSWVGLAAVALLAAACGSATTPVASPFSTVAPATATPTPTPTPSPSPSPSPTPVPSPASLIPHFNHIYVIVMENKTYNSIVGSKAAPYENSLIARYGLATNMLAETHPSEPNYIALVSGGTQGVRTDGTYNLSATSLFDQIDGYGLSWHVYAQGYPGGCYTGSSAAGVTDGPGSAGQYVRKHNPAISFRSISRNPARCAHITRLAGFDPAAADFELIIPNLINDMHSSSVAAGDAFLKAFVPRIVDSPAFAGSALFITWDEGAGATQHIATIVVSPGMTPGSRFGQLTTHYSLLRTFEDSWNLPPLGAAATSTPLLFPYFG
jgi:hypothetical protein